MHNRKRWIPCLASAVLLIAAGLLTACSALPIGPPPPRSYVVSLSDVDGDGDADAVVGNGPSYSDYGPNNSDGTDTPNAIWLNDGDGHFTYSGQRLTGDSDTFLDRAHAVAVGDLDGDQDVDLVFANATMAPNTLWVNTEGCWSHLLQSPNTVWLNDGVGRFTLHGEVLMEPDTGFTYGVGESVALGDLDGDGDLDAYIANCCRTAFGVHPQPHLDTVTTGYSDAYNTVWWNDGRGHFTDSGQRLGNWATAAVALGDLDDDGDLDAFEVNLGGRSESIDSVSGDVVWLNDGTGRFTDSGQRLGQSDGSAVALGDLDGDGDLDAFIGNAHSGRADEVWWNDGAGTFADSGQRLGEANTRIVVLDDVDRDGDIDAFVGYDISGRIWTNDGAGHFSRSSQWFIWIPEYATNLADVDGDGDQDVFAIRFNGDILVWRNDGSGHFWRSEWPVRPIFLVGGGLALGLLVFGGWIARQKRWI